MSANFMKNSYLKIDPLPNLQDQNSVQFNMILHPFTCAKSTSGNNNNNNSPSNGPTNNGNGNGKKSYNNKDNNDAPPED